ncbi:hypothetical protein FHE66_14615 [Georgenia sp. 311]|uniref:methylation-associated defense system protein MAD7 n=1 Tax=Georgenia sp. 311 TaxID=2585134 RepID=UPI0011119759|nr:hypothetical protein [Georgenia sp. 311]TNC16606.1 hypothetical protein FHE66_14615 [Georgenia sp. 311]
MKIELPPNLRTFAFTELTLVELNDTDVERMLTQVFEMAIKQGRTAPNGKAAGMYTEKLHSLAESEHLDGFDNAEGSAVLDGWLRSSVVEMGRAGRTRASEQMQFLRPSTVAVYRAGFPARSRHRQADYLIYREMLRASASRIGNDHVKAKVWVGEQFRASFGAGVTFSDPPKWAPEYDGTDVDISTLLTIRFLEQFEAKSASKVKGQEHESPVPGASAPLGRDVIDYVQSYGKHAPALMMSRHLAGIIGLRLFQLPLRIAQATRQLITVGTANEDMLSPSATNKLEQYVDFTGEKGSASDTLARQCVQRDLASVRQFFWDRLYLRSISDSPDGDELFHDDSLSAPEKFMKLAAMSEENDTVAHLRNVLKQIRQANKDTDDEDTATFLQAVLGDQRPAAEKVADVLVEALKKRGYENAIKWFWSTGGIKTDVGILSGPLNSRRSWTYAPSDLLLSSLLALTFSRSGTGVKPLSENAIDVVLGTFENRFGILVNRPPAGMDSAENRAAAARNFEAFKQRLHLLGAFDGLSDDLSAQRVRNPLMKLLEGQ